MKQRRLIAGALGAALALSLTLTACAGDPGTTGAPGGSTGGDQEFTIAIVPKDSTNPWFVRMEEGVKRYAADNPGLNVFQKGPAETDATMQAQVIQDLIA